MLIDYNFEMNHLVHFKFNLKCPNCGYHKGILKCVQCEDRKRDDWR